MMNDDWRLTNQMNYLYKAVLKKEVFKATERNDHEHCEFCYGKFAEFGDAMREGYCTLDKYRWICNQCFDDFKTMFQWTVVD